MLIPVRSISLYAARVLQPGIGGRVLASFERVCDLVTDAGEVTALVWGGIGNGPLNVVLPGDRGPGIALPAGARFAVRSEGNAATFLVFESPATGSPIAIDLASAVPWDARPDWDRLRARRAQIVDGAALVAATLAGAGWSLARCGLPESVCERAARGEGAALSTLVGLGPGLTPAGDDWLAGWLLAQHVSADLRTILPEITTETRSARRVQREPIAEIAADRTTTLSRALLACAAAGEADESWHALLSALAADPMTSVPVYQSTQAILSHGATSGAAMLTGFCAGLAHLTPDACSLIPDP